MPAGINLPFFADVRAFLKGTDSIADALDDVAGSLDDLDASSKASADRAGDAIAAGIESGAKDATRAGDKLERDLGDNLDGVAADAKTAGKKAGDSIQAGMKDGAGAADAFEAKVSDSFRAVAADAKSSGDKVGKSQHDGFKEASEGAESFKESAASNAKEVAASFDGSVDSISDGFQGLIAEMLEGFGPVGIAGGVAIAVGMGIAIAALQGEADAVNKLGDDVSAMADKIKAAGGDIANVDFAQEMIDYGFAIQDTKEWFEFFQDKAETGFEQIKKRSKEAGVSWVEAFKGTKGTAEDSRKALEDVNAKLDEAKSNTEHWADAVSGMEGTRYADPKQVEALEDLKKKFEANIETLDRAESANRDLAAAGIKTTEQLQAEKDATDKANDALLAHADALDAAAGRAMDSVSAEIAYNDAMSQGAKDIAANGKGLDLHTAVGKANQQTLLDMAKASNDLTNAQVAAGGSTADVTAKTQAARDAFTQAAEKAGYSADAAQALADKYGIIPKNVATRVEAHNVEETKAKIDGVANANRTAVVNVVPSEAPGAFANYIAGMNGRKVYVDVVPRNGVGITN